MHKSMSFTLVRFSRYRPISKIATNSPSLCRDEPDAATSILPSHNPSLGSSKQNETTEALLAPCWSASVASFSATSELTVAALT
jgi:hypothetical protein